MNIPNIISLLRLFLTPLIVWLLILNNYQAALIVFSIASLSDLLDGYLARFLNCDTMIGRLLDPIADKILIITIFITLGFQQLIPGWLVILVVCREIIILGGSTFLLLSDNKIFEIKPIILSKVNTFIQILLVLLILLENIWFHQLLFINDAIFIISAVFTITSCMMYLKKWIDSN